MELNRKVIGLGLIMVSSFVISCVPVALDIPRPSGFVPVSPTATATNGVGTVTPIPGETPMVTAIPTDNGSGTGSTPTATPTSNGGAPTPVATPTATVSPTASPTATPTSNNNGGGNNNNGGGTIFTPTPSPITGNVGANSGPAGSGG